LNPGEVVVIDGQDKLQEGTKVNPSSGQGRRNAGATADNNGNPPPANGQPQTTPPAQPSRGNSR
jgi:hypothetical protein